MTLYDLADLMHKHLCSSSHDEYSPWCKYQQENLYTDKWTRKFHAQYLEKATKSHDYSGLELEDIARVVKAL